LLHTVRSKIILLGVAALALSLGIALPLELLAGRQDSQLATRRQLDADVAELVPVLDVLRSDPQGPDLVDALFRRLGRTEELYILDSRGNVLFATTPGSPGRPHGEVRVPLPEDAPALLELSGPPVTRSVPSSGSRSYTEIFAPLGGGDTLLAVSSPGASVRLRHLLLFHTVPPLLLAVLLLGATVWIGLNRLIMRPLGLLSDSARRVLAGEGEAAGIIPGALIPGDDVGEVLHLRNLMLQRLEDTRSRLEDQLTRRTFELEVTRHVSGQLGHFATDQELLQEVLVRLSQVVPWEVAAGFLVEAGRARVWAQSRSPVSAAAAAQVRDWLEEACPTGDRDHARVLRDLWDSARWFVDDSGGAVLERLASRLAFPLKVDGEFAGSVVLCAAEANAYAGHHQRIIREVLEQGLGAIGRTRRLVAEQSRGLDATLQRMSVGVLVLDGDDRVAYVNRSAAQLLARLEESKGIVGAHWRAPEALNGLFEPGGALFPRGVAESSGVGSLSTAQGTLRVTVVPYAGSGSPVGTGRLVVIEEVGPGP
jgi:PAS domain-containing protein